MAKAQVYAVKIGRQPGLYQTWDECRAQVDRFPGAAFKGFPTQAAAEAYLAGEAPAGQNAEARPPAEQPVTPAEPAAGPGHGDAPSPGGLARMPLVQAYTDGACLRNPGPGGYGVVLQGLGKRVELSAGYRLTTNNRMELRACLEGLRALDRPCRVVLHSDSRYVVNSMVKGWALRWAKQQWRRKGEPVPNADLWQELLRLCAKHHVTFKWVRGHAGHRENERCDELATGAARRRRLRVDRGYEDPQQTALPTVTGKLRMRPRQTEMTFDE